ncbi:MAG TPA: thiamine pyrophosphate-binding protein, partial [Longimicrobiales bacterium]|nr:thiamine pyrophosphate-binding protein [Longimicrobiales bacterium]
MNGVEALCGALLRRGVRHVFGLPGTQNAELFTALRRARVRPVLGTHELAASFMAIGYARVTGAPAVLATIPGPGFAFALPGLAEAGLDSVPLVHVVGTPARGPQRFKHQEIDQAAIAAPLVKRVVEVGSAADVARAFDEAWRLAASGEPGPVLLHVAPEALSGRAPEGVATSDRSPDAPAGAGREAALAGTAALADLLRDAARPVLFVGGGAARAAADVRRRAEALRAPT